MKKNKEITNAIRMLDQKKIEYKLHDYSDSDAISGMEVATYLNEDPNRVFKTLVTVGKSNTYYVFLVPVNGELDLKKAASSVGEKNVAMIKSKDLLPLTGYIHGGCSPIGMKKAFKTVIDISANNFSTIIFSGGKIGLQIETDLASLAKLISYDLKDITQK